MTQEEKQLLLVDLCAREPYHPRIHVFNQGYEGFKDGEFDTNLWLNHIDAFRFDRIEVLPYLRPMSSMTEEEREEWADLFNLELDKLSKIDDENKAEELAPYYFGKSHQVSIDWLNKKHFDYRGLIEKNLALKAPENV